MAKLPSSFNSDDHDELGDFSALPKGDYFVEITESDYVQNSKKTGHILKLVREITSGDFKGRKYYSNLNLDNPNPKAVEIANKEFTSTCKACGKVVVDDSEELHGIPHIISLGIDKNGDNRIDAIKPLSGKAETPAGKKSSAAKPGAAAKPRKKPVFED